MCGISIGNPKANVYQYLMAMNPHVQQYDCDFSESYWCRVDCILNFSQKLASLGNYNVVE